MLKLTRYEREDIKERNILKPNRFGIYSVLGGLRSTEQADRSEKGTPPANPEEIAPS